MVQPTKLSQPQLSTPSLDANRAPSGLSLGVDGLAPKKQTPTGFELGVAKSFGPPSPGSQLKAFEGTQLPSDDVIASESKPDNKWQGAFGEDSVSKAETPPDEETPQQTAIDKDLEAPQSQWSGKFADPAVQAAASVETSGDEAVSNPSAVSPDTAAAVTTAAVETGAEAAEKSSEAVQLPRTAPLSFGPAMLLKTDPVTGERKLVPDNSSYTADRLADQKTKAEGFQVQKQAMDTEASSQSQLQVSSDVGAEEVDAAKSVDENGEPAQPYSTKDALMYRFNLETGEPLVDELHNPILKSGESSANPQAALEASDAADAVAILRTGNRDANGAHKGLSDHYSKNGFAEGELRLDAMTQPQVMDEVNQGVAARYNGFVQRMRDQAIKNPEGDNPSPHQVYQMGVHAGVIDIQKSHQAPNVNDGWEKVQGDAPWPIRQQNGTEAKHLLQSDVLSPDFNPTGSQLGETVDGYKAAAKGTEGGDLSKNEKDEAFKKQLEETVRQSQIEGIRNLLQTPGRETQKALDSLSQLMNMIVQAAVQGLVQSTNSLIGAGMAGRGGY